jgi:hypothetical protein
VAAADREIERDREIEEEVLEQRARKRRLGSLKQEHHEIATVALLTSCARPLRPSTQ